MFISKSGWLLKHDATKHAVSIKKSLTYCSGKIKVSKLILRLFIRRSKDVITIDQNHYKHVFTHQTHLT